MLEKVCLRVSRECIPRFMRVMQNLRHPDLVAERARVKFADKFAQPGEPVKKEYSVSDEPSPAPDHCTLTPPQDIYALGKWPLYSSLMSLPYIHGGPLHIAVVGPLGPRVNANIFAREFAAEAVRRAGATIISGFAEGIDQAAHRGALNAMGKTIAFLPHGVMNEEYYTSEEFVRRNMALHGGGFVSEYYRTFKTPEDELEIMTRFGQEYIAPAQKMLLLRDGRTTALADAVVIVEASKVSGSEDTGRRAYLQGIPVFLVHWSKLDPIFSRGLPDPIDGGLRRLAQEGCAISYPLSGSEGEVPQKIAPRLFLEFVLEHLREHRQTQQPRISEFA